MDADGIRVATEFQSIFRGWQVRAATMGCHMNKLSVFKKKLVLAGFPFRILGRGKKDSGCIQRERSLRPKENGGVHRWDLAGMRASTAQPGEWVRR